MARCKCNLIIDSCCDLSFDTVNRDGVEVISFPYIMSDGEHLDDMYRTVTAHEFFESMRGGEKPSTAQIAITTFHDVFTRAAQSGVPTVYLSFPSALSGSFNTAVMIRDQVAAEYPEAELYVVDTAQASVAEGFLVVEALRQRDKGLTAKELVKWVEEARYFVDAQFMVDDLDSLHRGGRIPATVAKAGAALDVKPLLSIAVDGSLALAGVARGRKKGIRQLVEYYQKRVRRSDPWPQLVVIAGADCPKDVERLKEQLKKVDGNILFVETNIGPVIGSHVGPGMIALSFWGPDRREEMSMADRIARKVKGE